MIPLSLAEHLVELWTGTKVSLAGNCEKPPALAARAVAWATAADNPLYSDQHELAGEKPPQVGSGSRTGGILPLCAADPAHLTKHCFCMHFCHPSLVAFCPHDQTLVQ